jgi:hypothetical protein
MCFFKSFVMYLFSLPIYVNWPIFDFGFMTFFLFCVFPDSIQERCVVFVVMNNLLHDINLFLFL